MSRESVSVGNNGLLWRLRSIQVSRKTGIIAAVVAAVVAGGLGYLLFASGPSGVGRPEDVQKQGEQAFKFLSQGAKKAPTGVSPPRRAQ